MTNSQSQTGTPAPNSSVFVPMLIIGGMFFIFGFVTWLNGPLISFVKLAFRVDDTMAFLVPSVFYISYFFLSIPAAGILRRTGMKKGMALGLLVMAVGAAVFGQFTTMRVFAGALTGLFTIGAGLSLLQTASNPYISILGPIESAASRIAFMGICNKIAGILAPIVIGKFILSGLDGFEKQYADAVDLAQKSAILDNFAQRIYAPYLIMAVLLAGLAFFVLKSPLPEVGDEQNIESAENQKSKSDSKAYLQIALGFLAIFAYVGVEVMAGDAIGTYGQAFGIPLDQAKYFTSFTLAGMLLGYVMGLLIIPKYCSQEKYLALSAIAGIVLVIGAFLTKGNVSVGFVAALGVANAMMWPAIFPLGIMGLGKRTELGSAVLIMGIVGGAALPQLFAVLKNDTNFQTVFAALMIPAYLYILFFANFAGEKGPLHRK